MLTTVNFKPYQYKPLDRDRREIRLIQFTADDGVASSDDNPIRCTTTIASLDNLPKYFALLYVWGDNKKDHAILLDDQVLNITRNLTTVLQNLSFRGEYIWIDTICINQDDDVEKSWQVQAMKQIFQDAFKVLVWLGAEDEDIHNALGALDKIADDETLFDAEKLKNEGILCFKPDQLLDCIANFPPTAKDAVLLAGNPEKLGQVSICDYEMLHTVIHALDSSSRQLAILRDNGTITINEWAGRKHSLLPDCTIPNFFTWQFHYRKGENSIPLWRVLMGAKYNGSEASDGRDVVFALLGLTPAHDKLLPNYSLSIPEVYISVTEVLLSQGFLRILWSCAQTRKIVGLPTWVPDYASKWQLLYRAHFGSESVMAANIKADTLFNAATSLPPTLSFKSEADAGLFTATGTQYATVSEVISELCQSPTTEMDWDPERFLSTFIDHISLLISVAQKFLGDYKAGLGDDESLAVITRLLFMDRDVSQQRGRRLSQIPRAMNAYISFMYRKLARESMSMDEIMTCVGIHEMLLGRTLFTTKDGKAGNCPMETKPDDIVVVIYGAELPVILRPVESGRYELVGTTYVEGIMDGEALEGAESRTFDIR